MNLLVMGCRVMFGEVVGLVEAAFLPVDVKLSLANADADPIKVHVNCIGSLLFDGVIDACCGAIVHLDGHWGWRMVQFNESCLEGAGLCHCGREQQVQPPRHWKRFCVKFGRGH